MEYLHGTDPRTMAFINLYGVLGTLEELCALEPQAREILGERRISVGFQVANGPCATLAFDGGPMLLQAKIGIFAASIAGGAIGYALLRA